MRSSGRRVPPATAGRSSGRRSPSSGRAPRPSATKSKAAPTTEAPKKAAVVLTARLQDQRPRAEHSARGLAFFGYFFSEPDFFDIMSAQAFSSSGLAAAAVPFFDITFLQCSLIAWLLDLPPSHRAAGGGAGPLPRDRR